MRGLNQVLRGYKLLFFDKFTTLFVIISYAIKKMNHIILKFWLNI